MKIRSFEHAKQCLEDLRDFLEFADSAISGVSALKGGTKQQELGLRTPHEKPSKPAVQTNVVQPEGWTDGVRQLLKAAEKPLRPVDILELWIQHGWDYPHDRRDFYIAINGGLTYLRKKGIVDRVDGKYTLKQ